MANDAFKKIGDKKAAEILPAINEQVQGPPFDLDTVTLLGRTLPFYPGYEFLSITNYESVPPRTCGAFYKPGELVMLNTTSAPIHEMNKKAPLLLNEQTIVAYLRFYFEQVHGKEGIISIVESIEDLSFEEEPPKPLRKAVSDVLLPATIISRDESGYVVRVCAAYKKAVFRMDIRISVGGDITTEREEVLIGSLPLASSLITA